MVEKESIKVYVSYSRKDADFTRKLVERLKSENINVWVDWEEIAPGADWMQEIQNGIESSDAFIFIMSPDALKSQVLGRELELAVSSNKRLIPILYRDVNYKEVPISLGSLNWLFIRQEDDFESAFSKLLVAIQTDPEWIMAHTRLFARAMEWDRSGRNASHLLRGLDYQSVAQLVTKNNEKEPFLTEIQREYLLASQRANMGLFERLGFGNSTETSQQAQIKSAPTESVSPQASEEQKAQPVEVGKLFSVSTDQASGVDQLNYSRFANAFATLIKNPEATTPITIGIYGQWGSGKSFLMKKIKEALGKEGPKSKQTWFGKLSNSIGRIFTKKDQEVETIVIEFNAWVYSGSEHLWAGLVTHLYREVEKHFGLRMQLYRITQAVRRLFPKTVGIFLFYAIPGLLISLVIGFDNIQASWEAANIALKAVGVSIVGGSLLATLPTIWTSLKDFGNSLFMSQSANLQKLAAKPDFHDYIGVMADIKSEISFISQMLESRNIKRQTRIVLFIDDLDRCEHRKAVEVLQAIMLLLADRDGSPFVTFLGIDARVIVRAVEEHYGSVLVKAGINGYEYLDKIVQLPFVIPYSKGKEIGNYIESLIWTKAEKELVESKFPPVNPREADAIPVGQGVKRDATEGQVDNAASSTPEKSDLQIRTETIPVTFTKPEREALKECADDIGDNPRKIKRIVNIYRFVRLLFPPNFQQHQKIIRWILLTEQWPLHTAWILEEIEKDYSLKGQLSENKNSTILDVYNQVKEHIYSDAMDELMLIGADPISFIQFIKKEPLFTIQEIYQLLYPLTFNLNPAVRSEISKYKARMAEKFVQA